MNNPFTIYCQGETLSGDVTFWQEGKSYYYQSVGVGKPTKCSKKLYEQAKAEFEKQKEGAK